MPLEKNSSISRKQQIPATNYHHANLLQSSCAENKRSDLRTDFRILLLRAARGSESLSSRAGCWQTAQVQLEHPVAFHGSI